MNLIKSSVKIFASRIIKSVFGFLAVIVFSRELGASPLGTYYPFLALLGIVAIPVDFGINSAATKRISENNDKGEYLSAAIALKLPLLAVGTVAIFLLRKYIIQFLGADLATLLVLTLIANEGAKLSIAVLHGELRVGETAVIEIFKPLSWLVVGYLFYLRGHGVHSLVYGYLFGTLLMIIFGWWKVSIPLARPKLSHFRSLIDYGRFSVISSVGGFFYSWMDVGVLTLFVVLGSSVTRADIGAYENAWRLALIVMLLSKAISMTLFPQMSRWDSEDSIGKIQNAIPTAVLPALLIVIPAFAGTLVLSKDLLRVLFGPDFTVAWLALIVLTGGRIVSSVHIIFSSALNAIDRPDLAAYAAICASVLNLGLNVILIWQFGLVGAAIATMGSFAVNTALHTYFLNKFIQIDLPLREAAWSILASAVMALCLFGIRSQIEINTIFGLLSIVSIGVIIYTAVAVVYTPIRTTIQRTMKPLLSSV